MPEYPCRFLKMILTEDTISKGLILPEKFSKEHGKDLLERVTLKVPNGDAWQVNLKKSKGYIWLRRGWGEFVEFYGIKYGHLLQFIYEGSSKFRVTIFSANATEIVYPKKEKDDNVTKKDDRVSSYGSKTVKSEDETSGDETSKDENPRIKKNDGGECSRRRGRKQRMQDGTRNVKNGGEWPEFLTRSQRMNDGRSILKEMKAKFKSTKPFFIVCITDSYIKRKRGVLMPVEFREKLVKSLRRYNFDDRCLLQLENDGTENTWEVLAGDRYLGEADWPMFVKDNGIKIGDICIFKLLPNHENVIRVSLIRLDS